MNVQLPIFVIRPYSSAGMLMRGMPLQPLHEGLDLCLYKARGWLLIKWDRCVPA